jgi:hypothetical protein
MSPPTDKSTLLSSDALYGASSPVTASSGKNE